MWSLSAACCKLRRVIRQPGPMAALTYQLEAALSHGAVPELLAMKTELLIYLANAWDSNGAGLFDLKPEINLALALDWSLAGTVLPHALGALQASPGLRVELQTLLSSGFPRA